MVDVDVLDMTEVELAMEVDEEQVDVGRLVVIGVDDVLSVTVTMTVLVLVGSGCTIEIEVVASIVVVVAVDTMSVIVIVWTTVSVAVAVVVPLPLTLTTEYVVFLRTITGACCSLSAIGNASVWYGRVIAVERRSSVVGRCMIGSSPAVFLELSL